MQTLKITYIGGPSGLQKGIGCFKKNQMQTSELTSLAHLKYPELYTFRNI